ncbi:MAG: DUF92 domain-containing protein [Ferruginibacter sp.]
MATENYFFLLILLLAIWISVHKNKLTWAGAVTGGLIGCFVFIGAHFTGIAMLGLFFLLGTIATSWKINIKEQMGAAEKNKGRRTAGQVIANGGVAGITGLLAFLMPVQQVLFQLMMAAALASATADTLSSELGTVYGKKFYNILSFKKDKRGENGVISIEGTLFGIIGSAIIAVVFATGFGWDQRLGWIIAAGITGNIADSILGATLERKHYLNNDAVNFINTFLAAMTASGLMKLF